MTKRKFSEIDSDDSTEEYDEEYEPPPIPPPAKKRRIEKYIEIDYKKLTTLNSLIDLVKEHKDLYNKDIMKLTMIIPELEELKNLVGMEGVKKAITYQVLFFLQKLGSDDMMHTVIQGPPGCGKTTLAKIMGKIYLKLGFLKNNKFIIAKRSDLIGSYLGQTAKHTQKMIDKASGGVLFIDEAYALGNRRSGDSYSKECIDTLNQNLSEKNDFVCIIAGYEKDLKECFFSKNQGLERRFPWIYNITKYNNVELYSILIKLITDAGWNIEVGSIDEKFFDKNVDMFPHFGGSLLTLFAKIKMVHSQRVFGKPVYLKKIINKEDVDRGYELYLKYQKTEDNVNARKPPPGMYM